MSATSKIWMTIGIIIVIAIIVLAIIGWGGDQPMPSSATAFNQQAAVNGSQENAITSSSTIDADLTSIDAELSALNADQSQ